MSAKQKAVAWGMGILVWMNLLSVLLSAWRFGSIDGETVRHMGMIMLPPLAVGTLCLYRFRLASGRGRQPEAPAPKPVAETQVPVGAGR